MECTEPTLNYIFTTNAPSEIKQTIWLPFFETSTLPSNSSWPPNTVYCLRLLIQAKIYRTIQRCKTRKIVRNRIYLKRFRFGLLSRHRFISAAGKRNKGREFVRKRALPLFVPASQFQIVSNRPCGRKLLTLNTTFPFIAVTCNKSHRWSTSTVK